MVYMILQKKGFPDIEVTVTEGKTQIKTTYTDSNGKYEFKDLPQSINNPVEYYIEFTYDGINYIATNSKCRNRRIKRLRCTRTR